MKKFYYIVGAVVTAAAVFALIAVMLKKLRISLSIEGIDDEILEETDDTEVTLSIEEDESGEEIFTDEDIEAILTEEDSDQI